MASINKHFVKREKFLMSRVPSSLWPVRDQESQQEVSLQSFICVYCRSSLLTLPPELCLLSDQRRHNIHYSLESSWNHHPPLRSRRPDTIYGKIVFPEPGPWWPKDWELVPYITEDTVYLTISYNETSSYFGFLNITLNIYIKNAIKHTDIITDTSIFRKNISIANKLEKCFLYSHPI